MAPWIYGRQRNDETPGDQYKLLNAKTHHAMDANVCGYTWRFQKPEPDWRAQTKLQFGASPGGSAKAVENVVEQWRQYIRRLIIFTSNPFDRK